MRGASLTSNIFEDFIAPWMAHRINFRQFPTILHLTDWGVVMCELPDFLRIKDIHPAIADVADDKLLSDVECERQDASHALQGRIRGGLGQNVLIRQDYRFANTFLRTLVVLPAKPRLNGLDREVGRNLSGGVSSDSVDNQQEFVCNIDAVTVFVVLPMQAAICACCSC